MEEEEKQKEELIKVLVRSYMNIRKVELNKHKEEKLIKKVKELLEK